MSLGTGAYAILAKFAFGQHALKSVAIMAFWEAVILAGKGIKHKLDEKKTVEAYNQAQQDFEEVGMKVTYDIEDTSAKVTR